jgi:2-polyprenyl-3-methyl-5-hydroxy-6-metoxy-1,4-benzoquinol methylase
MVYAQKSHWVELCNHCGLGRTLPALTPFRQAERHINIYSKDEYINSYLTNYAPYLQHSFRRGLDHLKRHKPKGSRLLDIGCGFGFFLNIAQTDGYIVKGIEVSQSLAEEGNHRYYLKIIAGNVFDIELTDEHYDIITAWDVLEHLSDIERLLKQVSHLIKPDGVFLFRVPDFSFMQQSLPSDFTSLYLTEVYPLGLHEHLFHFSQISINLWLKRNGYEIIELWPSMDDEYTPKDFFEYDLILDKMKKYNISCEMNYLCCLARDKNHINNSL